MEKRHAYDQYGQVERTDDLGDVATTADDTCTRITYARNLTRWILVGKSRMETVSVRCDTTPSCPADLVSDVRSYFDGGNSWSAAPVRADATRVEEATTYGANGPVYTGIGIATYDVHGRLRVNRMVPLTSRRATAPRSVS